MKKIKGVVLDRDGTIIKHIHYLGDPSLVELNIDIKYFLEWVNKNNLKLFIHSNQSGLFRGIFTFNDLFQVHISMMQKLKKYKFLKVFYALDFKSKFRKPKSILKYLNNFGINKGDEIIYIGDSDVDLQTANKTGSKCYLLNTGLNKPKFKTNSSFEEIITKIEKSK